VNRENGAQIFLFAFILPFSHAIDGLKLPVGLNDTKLQVSGHDGIDVKHRTAGRFNRCADTVLVFFLVHDSGNSPARRIIDTGNPAGADGDKGCLGRRFGGGRFLSFGLFFGCTTHNKGKTKDYG
jgi:hypothetical protein